MLLLCANHNSAQSVAVAVEKFRGRVHHHVRAQRQRLLEIWRHECVVHDQQDFLAPADGADRRQIAQPHQRIGRRLHIDHPRVLADGAFDVLRVRGIDVRELQPEARHHLVEQTRRSAVQIVAADHVIAGLQHADDRIDRRHAAGENARGDSAFERGKILLQPGARGIRDAGIFISLVLADSLLDIGRSWIDGNGHRSGQGIGFLAGMNGARGKTYSLFSFMRMNLRDLRR